MHLARAARTIRSLAIIVVISALAGCGSIQRMVPFGSTATSEDGDGSRKAQMLRMAESAVNSGDTRTALGLYQQIASDSPDDPEPWLALGQLLLSEGEPQSAADAFAAALKRDPALVRGGVGYARAMMALGRPEAARAHIEPLLAAQPRDAELLNVTAVVFDLQGQHELAMQTYRRGLDVDPDSVRLRNNMALSAALAGDYETALNLLKPLAEGLESTRQARQNLALVYGLSGNLAEAERLSAVDLDADAVSNNLAFFAAMRSSEPSQARSAVLRPRSASLPQNPSELPSEQGLSMALGLGVDGETVALADAASGDWYVRLGPYADARAADAGWRAVKSKHAALVGGMHRLASDQRHRAELHIGPISDRASAQTACRALAGDAASCEAVRL